MRTASRPGRPLLAAVAVGGLLLAGCGSPEPAGERSDETAPPPVPTIVVTTSILGDVTENVVGDRAEVEVLMPPGADPHTFAPTAEQASSLRDADLVIANGVGLEAGLAGALEAAEDGGTPVFPVGDELSPIPHAGGGTQEGEPDPHVWMDPERMAAAALLIADEVAATTGVDPVPLGERALAYGDELREVDEEVQAILAAVPDDRRTLVTADDALGYFAERYGIALVVVEDGEAAIGTATTHWLGEPGSGTDTLAGLLVANARSIADALAA